MAGLENMIMLSTVQEQSVLMNLKKRFTNDKIYTYIGEVLISVNPFKMINGVYTDAKMKEYRSRYPYELPPHTYAVAESAYRNMVNERHSQAIVITGESGAGKTEASKHIMSYLASVSTASRPVVSNTKSKKSPSVTMRQQEQDRRQEDVKNQILQSNPLLEAFGNAKTVRNNNSSRFGKYMEIFFNHSGVIIGGQVTNFLLEKSRVISQTASERNFHIFYQLFTDKVLKQKLSLDIPQRYEYLNSSGCFTVPDIDDEKDFQLTKQALTMIGVQEGTQERIFELLAAILHLGNIHFVAVGNGCKVSNREVLKIAAYQLHLDETSLERGLTNKSVGAGGRRNSVYLSPLTCEAAVYARDALAKSLYGKLFDLIINLVNQSIEGCMKAGEKQTSLSIGILDIYGFEIFEKNSFEQLCINYVNERLQKIFIDLTLQIEQLEYQCEGIQWEKIPFVDNTPCVSLIDSPQMGVFSLLNEACLVKKTDGQFLNSLKQYTKTHSHMAWLDDNKAALNKAQNLFTIRHYAGDVSYDVDDFVQKNTDSLFQSLIDMMKESGCSLSRSLFISAADEDEQTDKTRKQVSKRPPMIATQFKYQVDSLMDKLYKCKTHYIRCMKPNVEKRSGLFKDDLMTHQIRYLGLLENIRVRRAGFVYRQTYERFVSHYGLIVNGGPRTLNKLSAREASERIIKTLLGSATTEDVMYAFGKTKMFVRTPETVFSLEESRQMQLPDYAIKIQRMYRRYIAKKYFVDLKEEVTVLLQKLGKRRRRTSVNRTLVGDHLNLQYHPSVQKILTKYGDSNISFSGIIQKTNRRLKVQERVIVITNRSILILQQKKSKRGGPIFSFKRRLEFNDIDGAGLSPFTDNILILGYPKKYDYFIQSDDKTEILAVMLRLYREHTGKEFNVRVLQKLPFKHPKGNRTIEFVVEDCAQPVTVKTVKTGLLVQVQPQPYVK